MLTFKWDHKKAEINQQKHGVSFEEASTALDITLPQSEPQYLLPQFRFCRKVYNPASQGPVKVIQLSEITSLLMTG